MGKRRCIFCMQEMNEDDKKCPYCKKGLWQYDWNPRWMKPYTVLKKRYMIGRVLGEGAFGVTYLAYDEKEEDTAAIKVSSEDALSEEAAVLEKMKDIPGVVKEKDFFQEKGCFCLAMEYLEGGSLKDYMKKYHQTPAEQAAEMLFPVMETLVQLHSRGILHGDISPDNLLFDRKGNLKLIDFGAALRKGKQKAGKELKKEYAPPEQYQDREKTGPWTDLYALCAVWYEMVTGHRVPPALQRIKKDSLRAPSDFVKVPEKMEQVFLRGLSVDVQRRYFSVGNLLSGLSESKRAGTGEETEIRRIWGNLWIAITTEVERDTASDVKKGRIRKRLGAAAGILLGIAAAVSLTAAGIWFYCESYPEEVLAFRLERDREEAKKMERKTVQGQNSAEFREAVKFLEENAYEVEEGEYTSLYRFSAEALRGWEYPGRGAGNFPIKADTLKRASDLFADTKREKEKKTFNGYVDVNHQEEWEPLYISLNWEESWYYGDDRVSIHSDYVTEFVTYVTFRSADMKKAMRFLYKMLPVVSPESYLTEEEIHDFFQIVKDGEDHYITINLNPKCQVQISVYEENFTAGIETA